MPKMLNMKKYRTAIILLLIIAAILTQLGFDKQSSNFKASAEYQPLVATNQATSEFNLGLQAALADSYWLQAIQYYGGMRSDHNYDKLANYLSQVTDLDPKFSYPYAFAALVLPSENINQGYTIAKKGVDLKLPDWQIPFYLATAYHMYKSDKIDAVKFFDIAAQTEGAPSGVKLVAAAYNQSASSRQTVEAIWQQIYENSSDSTVSERAKNYYAHYQLLDFYDEAAKRYQQKIGTWPKTLNDLIDANILTGLPADPLGFNVIYGDNGQSEFVLK